MNAKPITLQMHGILDYALAATMLVGPPALGINKKAANISRGMAANLVSYNAMTDYSVGLKPVISVRTHKKIDYGNLATMAAAFFYGAIKKDKKALAFHAGITALAAANVLFTDWESAEI